MDKNELKLKVFNILKKIKNEHPSNFSGIGIVVYDDEFDNNRHCNLVVGEGCKKYSITDSQLSDYLIEISDYSSCFHDGFHMINENGELTDISQYFVPPIVKGIKPISGHGVRTYSSVCGSTLKGVLFIAAICTNFQIFMFENGKDITASLVRECEEKLNV